MGTTTKIEWCDHSASPWHGCTHKVLDDGSDHPACHNCYAEAMAKRNPATLGVWGTDGTRVMSKSFHANCRRWNAAAEKAGKRQSVFPSICDPFEDWDGPILDSQCNRVYHSPGNPSQVLADGEFSTEYGDVWLTMADLRRDLFATIDACPWLDFLLLTKRPENVRRMWPEIYYPDPGPHGGNFLGQYYPRRLRNVFLGTSISNQATADELIPHLLKCRDLSPVLFLSAEPLLGPVSLDQLAEHHAHPSGDPCLGWTTFNNCLSGFRSHKQGGWTDPKFRLDWIIVGGESGHNARPMHPNWARSIRDQCQAAGVPFFFKQWGEWLPFENKSPCLRWESQQEDGGVSQWLSGATVDGKDYGSDRVECDPDDDLSYVRVGKAVAGRLLDGREWNEFPEVRNA